MLEVIQGDITKIEVDAIVNAANNALLGGGGVDGAIHAAGGPSILAACKEIRKSILPDGLPTGGAIETTAGDMPSKWIIHTVGPRYEIDSNPAELLEASYRNCFELALKIGAKSIAFPSISTGIFGYPLEAASEIALKVGLEYEDKFERVIYVLYSQDAFKRFAEVLKNQQI